MLIDQHSSKKTRSKGRFFFARSEVKGSKTSALLAPAITELLNQFPWPKSQRWRRGKFRWVRPLHRINLLFDGKPINGALDLGGGQQIEFGATSCGHYFEAPDNIDLSDATSLDDVKTRLRDAFVMVDPAERRTRFSTVRRRWPILNHARLMKPSLIAIWGILPVS